MLSTTHSSDIILFPKTNLKRLKLIKTVFLKIEKMQIAGFWKSPPQLDHLCPEFKKWFGVQQNLNSPQYLFSVTYGM